MIASPRPYLKKIKSRNALSKIVSSKKRKKFVFTNGCFDILHPGHVSYLFKARKLGDALIVALNTDRSVKKLKGPKRPINRLEHRLEVISALECVDYVTWFDDETPLETILLIRPKILTKGGDWPVHKIVGHAEVKDWGGKVKSLPYISGQSTTSILKKIQKRSN